jgi:hypothetical protein
MLPEDYPVHGEKALILKRETMADAVMTPDDYMLFGTTAEEYGAKLKPPLYPSSDRSNPFWNDLRKLIFFRNARINGLDPSVLNRWPDIWEGKSLEEIAEFVHAEYPAKNQQMFLERLFEEGIEMNYDMVPFRSVVDLIGTELRIAAINTWAYEAVGPNSFLLKWHVGMPRPEEVVWLIYKGAFTADDGVPQDIIDSITSMNLAHATEFTAYPEGSPMHPSWPAMHAAGSSCSMVSFGGTPSTPVGNFQSLVFF